MCLMVMVTVNHTRSYNLFKFIYLSLKVLIIVAGGHGGTRKVN